ncbi:hypothetical protein ACSR9E_10345 [Citrobacter koseri]|uniref:hypothetical protein n=1 Tax=Citrobacter koseri TaxID=545 RepID=UPI0040412D2A
MNDVDGYIRASDKESADIIADILSSIADEIRGRGGLVIEVEHSKNDEESFFSIRYRKRPVLNVQITDSTPATPEDYEKWKTEDFAKITDDMEVTRGGFADGGYTKGGRVDTEVCGQVSPGRLLMTVRVDDRDVLVPYQEEVSLGGYVKKIPIIDESNLIEVTTLGSNIPEFVTK